MALFPFLCAGLSSSRLLYLVSPPNQFFEAIKCKGGSLLPSRFTKNIGSNSNSEAGEKRLYYGWIVMAALLIVATTFFGISLSFGVFFKSLEEAFGWTRTMTSGVFSVYMALYAVFAIIGGWALDRYGAKKVVTLMGFFTGLSLLLTSQVNRPWQLFITYSLLLSIGTGPAYVVITATASRWFVRRRGLAVGIVTAGTSLGIVVMTPISAYLISSYGWQTSYFVLGLIALFVIVPCAQLLRKSPSEIAALSRSDKLESTSPVEEQTHNESPGLPLLQTAKTRNFWLLSFIWLLFAFCLYTVTTHIVPHAIDLGINPIQAASILTLIGGIGILGKVAMGRVSDSIGRKNTAMICTLLVAGAMLWLAQSSELWMLYLFAVAFGFFYGGLGPPISALVSDTFGLRHVGLILGILELGWGAGAATGPALAGYIFDIRGEYVIAFLTAMTVMLIATVLASLLRTPLPKVQYLHHDA